MRHVPEHLDDRHRPVKTWGWEEWIVNNELYCGKRLHFDKGPGLSTSLHFHMDKHETMYVERGSFQIETIDTADATLTVHTLNYSDSLVIPPGTPHRIMGLTGKDILVEFSTTHVDTDSHRVYR